VHLAKSFPTHGAQKYHLWEDRRTRRPKILPNGQGYLLHIDNQNPNILQHYSRFIHPSIYTGMVV